MRQHPPQWTYSAKGRGRASWCTSRDQNNEWCTRVRLSALREQARYCRHRTHARARIDGTGTGTRGQHPAGLMGRWDCTLLLRCYLTKLAPRVARPAGHWTRGSQHVCPLPMRARDRSCHARQGAPPHAWSIHHNQCVVPLPAYYLLQPCQCLRCLRAQARCQFASLQVTCQYRAGFRSRRLLRSRA